MKMTRRMKKILLVLLHPEKVSQLLEKSNIYVSRVERLDYYPEPYIMLFCAKMSSWWDFTHSEVVSYRRTFRIMIELGLIHETYEYRAYKLTAKGRQQAEKIEKDIRDFIKEYESLVD